MQILERFQGKIWFYIELMSMRRKRWNLWKTILIVLKLVDFKVKSMHHFFFPAKRSHPIKFLSTILDVHSCFASYPSQRTTNGRVYMRYNKILGCKWRFIKCHFSPEQLMHTLLMIVIVVCFCAKYTFPIIWNFLTCYWTKQNLFLIKENS